MKRTIRYFLVVIAIFLAQNVRAQKEVTLVPNPQEIEYGEGAFAISDDISINYLMGDVQTIALIDQQLKKEFKFVRGYEVIKKEGTASKRIRIAVKGRNSTIDNLIESLEPENNKRFREEGYILRSTKSDITIVAYTAKGAFYGAQTLKQLIRSHNDTFRIPAMTITDWPDLEIRGMMDDISRGPVPTKEYMYQQIERMAEMKVNLLTYYTQDVVKTESHPAFAPPGGALDIKEWSELADYAKKFHIDLVGNFQSFGHFDQILKHPEYAHLGESGMLLSPAFEESYELLEDIYTEMIPAFQSDYFHINSDETFDLGSGASKAMVDSLGESVVYANHIKRIHKIITGLGKKVMMWGDIALDHPEILDMLPKDIILITWGYDIFDDYAPRILPFKEAGFTQLVSTGILNSYSTIPDFNIALGNIGGFMAESKKQEVWGMLNTVWDDGGFALFSKDWYGVAYAADQSWNSAPNDESYDTRFNRAIYGSTNNALSKAILKLNELAGLKSTEKMNEDILWDSVIPETGNQVLINIEDWAKVRRIVEEAQSILQTYDAHIYSSDVKYIQHTIDLYKFLAKSRPAVVEAANLYSNASDVQSNKIEARKNLVEALSLIKESYDDLITLKLDYENIWVKENRVYALDRITSKFDEQLKAFQSVKDLLLSTIYNFDKGQPLPAASKVRLDIKESKGWYFQGWLMCEAFPNPNGFADPNTDHLADMNGIEKTFPNVTEEFYFNDIKYRWRRVNTPYFAKVDLNEIHEESNNVIGYAFAHIDIEEDRDVRALVGSSDGIEVFINGDKVHQNFIERDFELDQDELYLPLKKGRNHLMIRVTNKEGDWAFSFQLPDSEMRSYKNRYKIIE